MTTTKIITNQNFEGIFEGSVFEGELRTDIDGTKFWSGLWCSPWGSYHIAVPEEYCEIWEEAKHDPVKAHFRKEYAKDRVFDRPGLLPRQFIMNSIRLMNQQLLDYEKNAGDHELITQRTEYWLQSLKEYFNEHYSTSVQDRYE